MMLSLRFAFAVLFAVSAAPVSAAELTGFAVLPADTFTPGPTSGQFLDAQNGVEPPFLDRQPVQGVSALLVDGDGFLALIDNGFGTQKNSPDHLLRVLRLDPDFETRELRASTAFLLSDPEGHLGFPIVAEGSEYPSSDIPVPSAIRERRLLTGWDLDPESFRRVSDGSFWIGDEFGPFLVHVDAEGRVLEPPVELPGMRSPQNPSRSKGERARITNSGGFEGMALSADGRTLYPVIEKQLREDPTDRLRVYAFDLESRTFSAGPVAWYPVEQRYHKVTEFTALGGGAFLAVERDDAQGPEASHKRVYLSRLSDVDESGRLRKTLVVDLLAIDDPAGLAGMGTPFRFPFITTEAVAVVDDRTLVIINDNNYPMSVGRHVDEGRPDDTEMIRVRLAEPLPGGDKP